MKIKRDLFPQVDYGIMNVTTVYPGASPEDVELNVTNKIEDELKSINHIDKMTSFSMENISSVFLILEINTPNPDEIKDEIREAVGRVTDLPAEVTESPQVTEIDTSLIPVIEVGLSGDLPYRELKETARLFQKKLEQVSGVSRVDRFGYRAREIKVEVSPRAIKDYQIPLREIITAIQMRNIRGTTGSMESFTSEENLVTLAQFRDPVEVGDVTVRSTFEGPLIKVKDLAVIRDDFEDERIISRMNGKPAISFMVIKNESADSIRTIDKIRELAERERENLPEGVEILYAGDLSNMVRNRFDVVMNNGMMGLIFVTIILAFFLNLRTAFWVAMGIPVAVLGAIFFLPYFGVYLDGITLGGMILVIGIIVDDAIIIAENIIRRREMGDKPLDAAVNGVHEVFNPVVTTVLTTFLVFAPMFFISGTFGKFIFVIPMAITLALFVSLGEAIIALPAHLVPGLGKKTGKSVSRDWFRVLREFYQRIMAYVLSFRYVLVLLFVVLLGGSFWYAKNYMGFVLAPNEMAEHIIIHTHFPVGTPLETNSEKLKEIEKRIADLPRDELVSFSTRIGVAQSAVAPFVLVESKNRAFITLNLTPYSKRSRSAEQIVEELRSKTHKLEGFEKIAYEVEGGAPPVGKPITIRIVGSDDTLRTKLTDSVEGFLANIKGVRDIDRDDKPGKNQVEVKIDYDKMPRLGLTVADIAQNIRIAYDGEAVTSVRYGEEDVEFRIMLQEKARKDLKYLNELLIPNRRGRLIPLNKVAELKKGPGPSDYRHFDGERAVTIEADVDKDIVTPLEVTQSVFDNFHLDRDWPGMRFVSGGEAMETEESMQSLFMTMIFAVIGIYFLLVILFNSFSQPFLIMTAIPFGITGVIIAFGFHGRPFDFMSILGIIGLSGVVVNDSLVLVNHLRELKKQRRHESIKELIAEGTANRLRAIIITTLTTVGGLLPLAYGLGGNDPMMAPLALSLGWGLLFATPLTLVLVPCLYMICHDISGVFRRK
jgi:multidrug efflux pump subunit AcrB